MEKNSQTVSRSSRLRIFWTDGASSDLLPIVSTVAIRLLSVALLAGVASCNESTDDSPTRPSTATADSEVQMATIAAIEGVVGCLCARAWACRAVQSCHSTASYQRRVITLGNEAGSRYDILTVCD
eukprot:6200384-Pleurochrysis_carterae.AAC.12